MNPEPFLNLDRVIHEKGRLAIMSLLAASPELAFTELRDTLDMTDGNLTTHIRTLQEAGLCFRDQVLPKQAAPYGLFADLQGAEGVCRLHQPAGKNRPAEQE